jgi:hypothetical protein
MGDDAAAAQIFDFLPVGLGGEVVCDVKAAEFGDVVIAGHDKILFEWFRAETQRRREFRAWMQVQNSASSASLRGSKKELWRKADPRLVAVITGDAPVHNSPLSAFPSSWK